MAIIRAYSGETISSASVLFQDSNGVPLIGNAASWTLFDPNNNFVAMGSAAADMSAPGVWIASITIPSGITVTANQSKASVVWTLTGTAGVLNILTEWFDLYSSADDATYDGAKVESVIYAGSNYIDSVTIPAISSPVSSPTAVLMNETGQIVQTITPTNTVNPDGSTTLGLIGTALPVPTNYVFNYYLVYVTWLDVLGNPCFEAKPVYSVNQTTSMMAIQMRKLIDRANLAHIHPYLSVTAADLVTFVLKGFDIYNGSPPKPTLALPFNPPLGNIEMIIYCGASQWVQSQYLAEGYHAFNFQGQGVSLETDPTQYLSAFGSWLDSQLTKLQSYKQAWIQYGYPTVNNPTIIQTVSTMARSRGLFTNYQYNTPNPGANARGEYGGDAWLTWGGLRGWGANRL